MTTAATKIDLPNFSNINIDDVPNVLKKILADNKAKIQNLLASTSHYSWENLVLPLELLGMNLENFWSAISHLNNVKNSDVLRKTYNDCLPQLTAYGTELGQNEDLYRAFKQIHDSADFETLTQAQKIIIDHALRDFHLAGVNLPVEQKNKYRDIQAQLAQLSTKFEENLMDATDHWQRLVILEEELHGLPEHAKATAREAAKKQQKEGWLLTLDFPCYFATITYADNRALRQEIYTAYVTRASDVGPDANIWDNSQIMVDILNYRHQESEILGYANFAELSIVPKMANETKQVKDFLWHLAEKAYPVAKREWQELVEFANKHYQIAELKPWDVAYFSEKLCQQKFKLAQEELRPYFPLARVLNGMFSVVQKLYNITIKPTTQKIDTWHSDVQYFEIFANDQLIGGFYLDLFARQQKRGGAWMDVCRTRYRTLNGDLQLPIAFLTCNFSPASENTPSLLTHDEVQTLFHEFGHGLQHLLTQMEYPSVSGISGVAWDAVELPSQFMENWCWHKESIDLISEHYLTKEKLPEEKLQQLIAAKNFQAGMQMVRQLEFSLFDFVLHETGHIKDATEIQKILDEIREKISVVPRVSFNRFQNSFSHIFAGGYAAGYYSYKWAEVLSADAFTKFETNGLFDQKTGSEFLNTVLAKGGSEEAMIVFKEFMGREPDVNALLRSNGIVVE